MKAKTKRNEKLNRKPVVKPRKAAPPVKRKRHEKRDLAKTMFMVAEMTAAEIGKQLGIQAKTIGNWRVEDNWDDERTLRNVASVAIRKQILESMQATLDLAKSEGRPLTSKEVDQVNKLGKTAGYMLNEVGPQTKMEVLYEYHRYLDERDHECALISGPISLDFVQRAFKEAKGQM